MEMIQATPRKSEKTKDKGRSPATKQERLEGERGPMEKNWLWHLFSWYFILIYSMLGMRKSTYKMTWLLLYSDLKFK